MSAARSRRPNGADLLAGIDPRLVAAVRDEVLAHAARARRDAGDFFEFVMRHETTRVPLKVAPHQRVALDFILSHSRSVNMWPVGTSKTFLATALTLFFLGNDPTTRGAVVSAAQEQASKVVGMARDYLETSAELRLVFPHLRPSSRKGDPWTQTAITVERPPGIRDPSLIAHGIDSKTIQGSRLNWVIVDDILNFENTRTEDGRRKTYEWFSNSVLSRLDPVGSRVVVTNTAWHPDDLLHMLKKAGWATMRMDVYGDIEVFDDRDVFDARPGNPVYGKPWDSPLLRPADNNPANASCRLVAHDPDPRNEVPLWPARYPTEYIENVLRREHLPHVFNQMFRNVCRDDESSMCKREYLDLCMRLAREEGIYTMRSRYDGQNPTFTGVDLAVDKGSQHDETAFFTFEARPDGTRVILDLESGQWPGPVILDKLFQKQAAYNSIVCVESNAAQKYIVQFAIDKQRSIPVRARMTGRAKAHPQHGVASLFLEMSNGAWLIPNDRFGAVHPEVQKFMEKCLYYVPSEHTADILMASYMAREQARDFGVLAARTDSGGGPRNVSLAASIMSR